MKRILCLLLVLCGARAGILLPVEVFGPVGYTVKKQIGLASAPTNQVWLWMTAQGLFEGKASVRCNEGPWITLSNANCEYPLREQVFYGMTPTGQPPFTLHVLRLSVEIPYTNLVKGKNFVYFRYDGNNRSATGYRVIKFNLISQGSELLPPTDFDQDDPATWTPFTTVTADLLEGERLYKTKPIVIASASSFGTHVERMSSAPLVATCSGCHSPDGIDLKFFNFPKEDMMNEAMSLGYTKSEGQKLASWILTRPVPYQSTARPWNSPYQPGPGLDAQSVNSWVSGAGYDEVLDDDQITLRDIGTNINFSQTISARQVRLMVPLPTWQQWMPRAFPLDLKWTDMSTNLYYTIYGEIEQALGNLTGIAAARVFLPYASKWDVAGQYLPPKPADKDSPEYTVWANSRKAVQHWRCVRTWHLMMKHQMQEVGFELFGSLSDNRRWFHGELFRLGPHMLGLPHSPDFFVTFHQESMQWYQLQLVLNSGNRDNPAIVPIDWGYQKALCVSSFNNPLNYPLYGISELNLEKAGEVTVNGNPPARNNSGWNPFYCGANEVVNPTVLKQIKWIPVEVRRQTQELWLTAWLQQAELYSREQYQDARFLQNSTLYTAVQYAADQLASIDGNPVLVIRLRDFARSIQ